MQSLSASWALGYLESIINCKVAKVEKQQSSDLNDLAGS